MRRLELIDGLRGYFLVFMLTTHLFAGEHTLVRLNHAELGFVQDAQGFVFLSGLLVGILYARRMERHGFAGPARQLWRRAVELYLWTLGLMLAVLALRAILPEAGPIWEEWLGLLPSGEMPVAVAAAAMLYQPTFFDILPQYVLYLAVAPPLLWLCVTGRAAFVLGGSAIVWLAVQLGSHLAVADAINAVLGDWQEGLTLRIAFNPLGWQLLFFAALTLGAQWTQGRLDVARIFDPAQPAPAFLAAVVVVLFGFWRLGFTFDLLPEVMVLRFWIFENRTEFSLVFLVNFVALGYLVAWVLIAGKRVPSPSVRTAAAILNGIFTLPFLRL
ncbi:MAG TPA: OpgC domain-containing protein, partial [Bauldia sp.]|nr:OpgC domain-containing protein [Bauldia sp.]